MLSILGQAPLNQAVCQTRYCLHSWIRLVLREAAGNMETCVREGFKNKKNVKLGLLAEVRGVWGSEGVLEAQPVIRSVL